MNIINFLKDIFISKAYAQTLGFPLLRAPQAGGGPENYTLLDVVWLIGNIINVAIIIAGSIAVIYIIIAGFKYALAQGNPDAIQLAKNTILWAVIGLIICLAAYLIINFTWNSIIGGSPLPDAI